MTSACTLFDLDGVLTTRDTMGSLIGRRLVRQPWRLVAALPLGIAALLAPATGALRPRLHRALTGIALDGLCHADYVRLARADGARLASASGFARPEVVAEALRRLRGGRVVVVTGSEFHLARAFLDGVGLASAELIASELTVVRRRARFTRHNVGAAKTERVSAAGVALPEATLFTDSASDLPLALAAAATVLVGAGRSTRSAFAKVLPAGALTLWEQRPARS